MKQFAMSMFASEKDLFKAKCEYLTKQNEKLRAVATAALDVTHADVFDVEEYMNKLSDALDQVEL